MPCHYIFLEAYMLEIRKKAITTKFKDKNFCEILWKKNRLLERFRATDPNMNNYVKLPGGLLRRYRLSTKIFVFVPFILGDIALEKSHKYE